MQVEEPAIHVLQSDLRPIRGRRPLSVATEMGYNGLSGLGIIVGYQLTPHAAVDLGLGMALQQQPKLGLLARFEPAPGTWSPSLGFGVTVVPGSAHSPSLVSCPDEFDVWNTVVMGLMTVGVSAAFESGLTLRLTTGAALQLSPASPRQANSADGPGTERLVSFFFGSGPVLNLAVGYAF